MSLDTRQETTVTDEHRTDDSQEFTELPGRVRAELTRLRAEREIFDDEQERLKGLLTAAEEEIGSLRTARADHDELEARVAESAAQARQLDEQHRTAVARAEALDAEVTTLRGERDALRAELAACRGERDELRLRLFDAEAPSRTAETSDDAPADDGPTHGEPGGEGRRVAAEERALAIAQELDATRRTLSWRVTAPLRAIRGYRRSD